ncbi:ETX/MTX2 family pore-forming toxin [Micromonospora sp. WMMA1363]|uniref:ETX/MTX2 family pore-forming toxin n=1 Tax=Micromonospora sp. WMMA1363 TaxID=3053985 RepID=UPI00338F610F
MGLGADVTNTISYSDAVSRTATTKDTCTLPSQKIEVPARTRACVYGSLVGKRAVGNLALHTKITGNADVLTRPHVVANLQHRRCSPVAGRPRALAGILTEPLHQVPGLHG